MSDKNKNRSQGILAKLLLVSYAMRRVSYFVRALVGAYLVYLMYQLFSESTKEGTALTIGIMVVGVVMMLAGIYFVIGAVYGLANGIYEENDPKKLEQDDEEQNEEN